MASSSTLRESRPCCTSARSRSTLLALTWSLWLATACSPARADDLADPPAYREVIGGAIAEYEAEHYLEAHALFAQAHELFPNARTLRGLGVVSFELRRYSESITFLAQALASKQKPFNASMRTETEKLLARARAFVAQITLVVEPANAAVVIDGAADAQPLPERERPLLLDVGPHQLDFRAPGYLPARVAYTVKGGEAKTWKVTLRKANSDAAGPQAVKPVAARRRWQKALGGTAIGLGAAALVTAGVLTARRHDEGERYRAHEPDDAQAPLAEQNWENTRAMPYLFAGLGTALLTSGALGLMASAPREALGLRVAAGISGGVGLGLAGWGIANLVRGGPCDAGTGDRTQCSEDLERKDQGGVILLSSLPLLALPLAQLFRHGTASPRVSAVSVSPSYAPRPRAAFFHVQATWF